MAREIPQPVRAVAGLAATVLDEARRLPETLPGLPVRIIGLAMQLTMKVQQEYAGLVARGDELLTGVRGEDEPGLATFDDDDDAVDLPAAGGAGTSSFDRVAETIIEVTEDDEADALVDEALDELAIEELVEAAGADADELPESAVLETSPVPGADAPLVEEPAPSDPGGSPFGEAAGAPDVGTTVDVVTPEGEVATVEAAVTDEGVAAVEGGAPVEGSGESAQPDGGDVSAAATATEDVPAAGDTAPVDGYDDWSVAQLRGRLRGYQLATVAELVSYEEANRAREPYLRMLRNRLEKLEQQAVESSPLAPRGM